MPHSGGGGHSGGGFHGGSSHGTGSSGSSQHYSNKPFHGARPYIYYRHHVPIVFYSDRDPRTHKPAIVFPMIILGIMGIAAPAMIFASAYHNPSKNTKKHEETVFINDTTDVLSDEEEFKLGSIFTEFNEKTGVMPALITVDYKTNLEDYVLDYYVNKWDDESHWLIAYCSKSGTAKTNWKYEIAQGYDTDDILYDSIKDRYFHPVLCDSLDGDSTVGESFIKAFDSLMPELLKKDFYVGIDEIMFAVVWEAFIGVFAAVVIASYVKEKAMQKSETIPEGTNIVKKSCPHCGTAYYEGINDRCHKCGHTFLDDEFEGF